MEQSYGNPKSETVYTLVYINIYIKYKLCNIWGIFYLERDEFERSIDRCQQKSSSSEDTSCSQE